MRILWATVMALAAIHMPAAAQEELRAEPGLGDLIAHFFPGYEMLSASELDPSIPAKLSANLSPGGTDASPTHIRADFDGNGLADHAVLIRKTGSEEADEIFAILMSHGNGRYSKAMVSFFGNLSPDIYLDYLPAGTVLPASGEQPGEVPGVALEHPAVTLNLLDQLSDAFFWDGLAGRFRSAAAP